MSTYPKDWTAKQWEEWRARYEQEGYNAFYLTTDGNVGSPYSFTEQREERNSFFTGVNKARDEHIAKLTAEFRTELDKLCEKYKVRMTTGCGCCGQPDIEDAQGKRWDFSV